MKIKHVLLFIVTGMFLAGYSLVRADKPVKPFEIEFVVTGGGTKLKVVTPDNGCNKNEDGCMQVPTINSGDITFKFQRTQQLPCSDHPNSWILSKIELANIEGGFGQPVNEWIVKDFGADASTGVVWQKAAGVEVVSHTITDKNNNSGVAYYLITAESCNPARGPVDSDPRVINEG